MAISIFRDTDDSSWDRTFVFIFCCKESRRRTSIEHRNTKTLAATEYYVCAPFSRRCQQYQTHQVSSNCYFCTISVSSCDEFFIVFNRTVSVWILNNSSKHIRGKFKCAVISSYDFDALRNSTSMYNCQCGCEYLVVNKQSVSTCFYLCTASCSVEHGHSLCGSSCFVQQRTVSQRKSSQVTDNSLEVDQCL